jgi:membrane protein YdbS with pleckstrin-like domain
MKTLKRLNTFFLIAIVLLILIDILFANYLTGIWNQVFIALLAISLVLSVVIEVVIKKQKKKS